jgi:RNA polymerase sigma factor (sigma-70 family)
MKSPEFCAQTTSSLQDNGNNPSETHAMSKPACADVVHYLRRICSGPANPDLTDGELLERFRARGEEAAFAVLVQRHGPMVLGVCRRVLGDVHAAEDSFQATFMVLARRADSLAKQDSVGRWLYGVAQRIALRARARAATRREREKRCGEGPLSVCVDELERREAGAVLDEEIGRLPPKYQMPIILCYLEGMSQERAARALGCPKGSLARRLGGARALLRRQLTRRGITSAGVLAVLYGGQPARAAVPARLVLRTVAAAKSTVTGSGASLGAFAVQLAEESLRQSSPLTTVRLLVLLTFTVAGAGLAGFGLLANNAPPPVPGAVRGVAAKDEPAKNDPRQAVDADGAPLPQGALGRLGSARFRYDATSIGGSYRSLTYALGGKVLASSSDDSGLSLWDAGTGKLLHRLWVPRYLGSMALSPDGTMLFTDGLSLVDVAAGKEVRLFQNQTGAYVFSVAYAPDGKTVAGADHGGDFIFWDVATGRETHRWKKDRNTTSVIAFAPDGKALAVGNNKNVVRLLEIPSGRELRRFEHDGQIVSVTCTPDGTLAAVARNGVIRLWDMASGKLRQTIDNDGRETSPVVFSADGKLMAWGRQVGVIRVCETRTGKEVHRWEARDERYAVAFAPDGGTLAGVGTFDSAIRRWDLATGRALDTGAGHTSLVHTLRFRPDGKTLLSRSHLSILEWDQAKGRLRRRIFGDEVRGTGAEYTALDVTLDGKTLAEATRAGTRNSPQDDPVIRLRDAVSEREIRTLAGHTKQVYRLKFSADGTLLVSGGEDGMRLWHVATGAQLGQLKGEYSFVTAPAGSLLAYVDDGNILRLWDMKTQTAARHWDTRQSNIDSLVFAPDAGSLATSGTNGQGRYVIHVWDTASGELLTRLEGKRGVEALAFSPSGRILASGIITSNSGRNTYEAEQSAIVLWDVLSGEVIRSIDSPQGRLGSLAFAPDSRTLASGGGDSTILLWKLAAMEQARPAKPLTAGQLNALWSDLAGAAPTAERAIWALALAPAESVPFLKERLHVVPAPPDQLARLIADLDSTSFAVRTSAGKVLAQLGPAAETALRKALTANPPLEVQRRLAQLLEMRRLDNVRPQRAIETLEHIATAEARAALEMLAREAPSPRTANLAAAALKRLVR